MLTSSFHASTLWKIADESMKSKTFKYSNWTSLWLVEYSNINSVVPNKNYTGWMRKPFKCDNKLIELTSSVNILVICCAVLYWFALIFLYGFSHTYPLLLRQSMFLSLSVCLIVCFSVRYQNSSATDWQSYQYCENILDEYLTVD